MPSIAIIGASNDSGKYGHAAVLAFLQAGWVVHPVNPKEQEVAGLKAYASIVDVPQPVDWVSLYVPPTVGESLLPGLAQVDASEVWFNPGSATSELLRGAQEQLTAKVVSGCTIRAIGMDPKDYF
ncbi:MAG: CoA-binding protein [Chthoniobacterales bacterium]